MVRDLVISLLGKDEKVSIYCGKYRIDGEAPEICLLFLLATPFRPVLLACCSTGASFGESPSATWLRWALLLFRSSLIASALSSYQLRSPFSAKGHKLTVHHNLDRQFLKCFSPLLYFVVSKCPVVAFVMLILEFQACFLCGKVVLHAECCADRQSAAPSHDKVVGRRGHYIGKLSVAPTVPEIRGGQLNVKLPGFAYYLLGNISSILLPMGIGSRLASATVVLADCCDPDSKDRKS